MKKKLEHNIPPSGGKTERQEITEELRESYLSYAMSVIVSRALPDVRDGLKPVQRRILWAMHDMGLGATGKFIKSARVVGEALGKYHPHGDTAVYDAMVRMAQDFSLRYPLVQGQGNFGSVDGDSAAAQRYTEARLSKVAEELLTNIEKETVDWKPNYDSTREEPVFLPASLPNLLMNGATGIAVGMATSIPPHNFLELADGIIHLSENPDASISELMKFVPGPDFPTGGIIYDKKAVEEAYSTGKGSIAMRGVATIEEKKSDAFSIVITEIPYMVNKADLVTKIAGLVQDKRLDGIKDLRDESDREGFRIVVELKSGVPPQKILNKLYKTTELQKNIHFNMLALPDGLQPEILSLKKILSIYLEHRKLVIRRRTEFDLRKAEERAHILEGLVTALGSIDKIIATIKKSKDKEEASKNLVKNFKLTPIQAGAILEMRLQSLAALEREKIEEELKEKKKLISELKLILKSPKKIVKIIQDELKGLKERFSDPRRTKIVPTGVQEFKDEDLIPNEEAIITLTQNGYIKRMPPTNFRAQKRGGKGLIGFDIKEGDAIEQFQATDTHSNILFFTDQGKVFQTKIHEIPSATRTAKGKLIHNYLDIPSDERVNAVITYPDSAAEGKISLLMVTKQGVVKKTLLSEFENVRRTGIIALSLKKGEILRSAELVEPGDEVIVSTSLGQAIRFKESDVRPMGRTAAGVSAIKLKKSDMVAGLDIIKKGEKSRALIAVMAKGFAKQTPLKEYKTQKRGGSGIRTAKVTDKTGPVIATRINDPESEEIIAFSRKGQAIRVKISDIRVTSRSTQGVRIMNMEKGDELVGIVQI